MRSRVIVFNTTALVFEALILSVAFAIAGPVDIILEPASQANDHSCQSYSLAIAVSLHPKSTIVAKSTAELRKLELSLRQAIEESAIADKRDSTKNIQHKDWASAVKKVTAGKIRMKEKVFTDYDQAMKFVADTTGVANPSSLGTALSAGTVKTPVLMSFKRIQNSTYESSHVVTVFGVESPTTSHIIPQNRKLLLLNSAIRWGRNQGRFCSNNDLSRPGDLYHASASLTDDYEAYHPDGWHIEYLE